MQKTMSNTVLKNSLITKFINDRQSQNTNKQTKQTNNTNDTVLFQNKEADNANNMFLKSSLMKTLEQNNVNLPQGAKITATSPKELSKEVKQEFKDVIFKDYKGFTLSLFELLAKKDKDFEKSVAELKFDDPTKKKIKKLKGYVDNYYAINLTLPDDKKEYNLLNLSKKDKEELSGKLKDEKLANILIGESDRLKAGARNFSEKEIKKEIFFEAGKESRDLVTKLLIMTGVLVGMDNASESIVKIAGQRSDLLKKGLDKGFWIIGSGGDDVAGCYKDYFQDKEVLGQKTALPLALVSGAIGIGSSIAIGTTMDDIKKGISHKLGHLKKEDAPKELNKNAEKIINKIDPKSLKKLAGRTFPPATKALMPLVVLFGLCSSGSSIASNIGTFGIMMKNRKKLQEKGVFKKDDNSFGSKLKDTWKNYASYEAYIGKVVGIASCIPFGIGLSGLIFSKNKLVKAVSIAVLGTCETLVACAFQKGADKYRRSSIDREKKKFVGQSA